MPRITVYPFLRPREDRIAAQHWLAADGEPLPTRLDTWDPAANLRVTRTLTINAGGVRQDCRLSPDTPLRVVAVFYCQGTHVRDAGPQIPIDESDSSDVTVSLELPGAMLSEAVDLVTCLCLARSSEVRKPFIARTEGTVLWSDSYGVRLEGTGSRFPMEVLDFRETMWLPAGAAYFLSWDPEDLDIPVTANIRLYINRASTRTVEAVSAARPAAEQRVIRESVMFDVARTLVHGALRSDMLRGRQDFQKGTVGYHLLAMLRAMFSEPLPVLRTELEKQPAIIDSKIQAHLRLFE